MPPLQKQDDHKADNHITVDSNRKIFMDIRRWTSVALWDPGYEGKECFMRFIDKYVRKNINGDMTRTYLKNNRNKTLLHQIKPGYLAYVTLIYEAKRNVWENSLLGPAARKANIKTTYQKNGRIKKYETEYTHSMQPPQDAYPVTPIRTHNTIMCPNSESSKNF